MNALKRRGCGHVICLLAFYIFNYVQVQYCHICRVGCLAKQALRYEKEQNDI
uniref:Uncharacterized protein n=1 Tax=Anguilla anguilla TaxID=7936 RepID=A0A0E9QLJ0_ANGAN